MGREIEIKGIVDDKIEATSHCMIGEKGLTLSANMNFQVTLAVKKHFDQFSPLSEDQYWDLYRTVQEHLERAINVTST
jgi:hypothetical protein